MGRIFWLCAVVIGARGFAEGHFCDLPTYSALITPCLGPQGRSRPDNGGCRLDKIASLHCQKYRFFFALASPHYSGVLSGSDSPNFGQPIWNARSVALRQKD